MTSKKKSLSELKVFLDKVANDMNKEIDSIYNLDLKCHFIVSREFKGFENGPYAGLKIKLSLEPDKED